MTAAASLPSPDAGSSVAGAMTDLRGRRVEREALDRLLADARAGHSRALVLRGEPGIGKTALLRYLAEQASGCQIVRAAGVESEMELPYAALHQLCAPLLDRLDALPAPQREAVGTAFGLTGGEPPNRFFVALAALGLLAAAGVLAEIGLAWAATQHGPTPARIVQVTAGPYPLTVSLYKDPAAAGFALPFAIAPAPGTAGPLTFAVTSLPGGDIRATPVRASLQPDPATGGVQGAAEITVRGPWSLDILVTGPQGQGHAAVPITAEAPPPIPLWLGWLAGLLPLAGLTLFLLFQRGRAAGPAAAPGPPAEG